MSRHCSSYGAYLNSSRLSRTHCVKTPSTTASVDCDQASHIDGSVFRVFLCFSQLQHHCTIFALHFANDFTTTEANSSHVGGGRICSFWTRRLHGAKLKIALKCLNSFVRGCSFSLFCRYARQYTAQCEKNMPRGTRCWASDVISKYLVHLGQLFTSSFRRVMYGAFLLIAFLKQS